MRKNDFYYFITPFGVISFSKKYVFINGCCCKSFHKIVVLLQKFDKDLFNWHKLAIYWCYRYSEARHCLQRYLNSPLLHTVQITKVYSKDVTGNCNIFHGQSSVWPRPYVFEPIPF